MTPDRSKRNTVCRSSMRCVVQYPSRARLPSSVGRRQRPAVFQRRPGRGRLRGLAVDREAPGPPGPALAGRRRARARLPRHRSGHGPRARPLPRESRSSRRRSERRRAPANHGQAQLHQNGRGRRDGPRHRSRGGPWRAFTLSGTASASPAGKPASTRSSPTGRSNASSVPAPAGWATRRGGTAESGRTTGAPITLLSTVKRSRPTSTRSKKSRSSISCRGRTPFPSPPPAATSTASSARTGRSPRFAPSRWTTWTSRPTTSPPPPSGTTARSSPTPILNRWSSTNTCTIRRSPPAGPGSRTAWSRAGTSTRSRWPSCSRSSTPSRSTSRASPRGSMPIMFAASCSPSWRPSRRSIRAAFGWRSSTS